MARNFSMLVACGAAAFGLRAEGASAAPIVVGELGNTIFEAFDLDGHFSLDSDVNIFNSTTVPHASVVSEISPKSDIDFYSFTGQASATLDIDIDFGNRLINSDDDVDTVLALFDSLGRLLAYDDESDNTLDPGSASENDAYIGTYTLPATDTYYIGVTSFTRLPRFDDHCGPFQVLFRPDGESGGFQEFNCSFSGFTYADQTLDYTGDYRLNVSLSSASTGIPEPASLALFGFGLAGLGYLSRSFGRQFSTARSRSLPW
jgi:Bacterial pre-peptidase C-terminal domain/PEP-CTERM motif